MEKIFSEAITDNVRSVKLQVSRRNRQCAGCAEKVLSGYPYVCYQFRYDKTIIVLSYHFSCSPIKPL